MQKIVNKMKVQGGADVAGWLFIILGIILRVRQYLTNRSLWADEASLAVNIANRSFGELTQLLDYQQAAPVGFLFIEKALIVVFGNQDFILRLFPLFSGILAIYLIYRIAREHIGKAGMFAVMIFAISWGLVYYSSELKQYISDVMVALLLLFLTGSCLREKARAKDYLVLGLTGSLVIWISHPSVFVLAGIGLALVYEKIVREKFAPLTWILALGVGWAVSFGLEYLVSLQKVVAGEYLIDYWSKAYMPLPPWNDFGWFVKMYRSFLITGLHIHRGMSITFIVLVSTGSLSLLSRKRSIALILLFSALITLGVSAMQRYPFMHRFILFLLPFAMLLMAEGLRCIYSIVARWNRLLSLLVSGIPVMVTLWFLVPIVYWYFLSPPVSADIKPVMQYVANNRKMEDVIYVYHSSDPAFRYYAPFYGLAEGNVIIGFETTRKKLALRRFYEDVDALQGYDRVWFIFSDIVDCGGCEGGMQQYYVDYLDGFGTLLDSSYASGANAYLYAMKP